MSTPALPLPLEDFRGGRRHRYMESADINAAFRAMFRPLRSNIRRGMTNPGQIYAVEMDGCIPGEVLGSSWIPPATCGIGDPALLADTPRRRALFARLLAEPRTEAFLAWVCERPHEDGVARLHLEITSADSCHAVDYPVVAGRGWHRRDLLQVPHYRVDLTARA